MITYMFNGQCDSNIKQAFIDSYGPHDKLKFVVETTAEYKKSGIYSATRDDTSKPIVIDWGDGTVERVDGDISQKAHTYDSVGTFNVVVTNIKTFAASGNNGTWYNTTSQNSYTLKEVVAMPDSITSIANSAFMSCANLTKIEIRDVVTSIGYSAFSSCTSLESVTIPANVVSIGNNAFQYCRMLTSIDIPDNITKIDNMTFNNCSGLTTIVIPSKVKNIGVSAFFSCSGLISITIPNSVTSIDQYAFWGCSSLTSVTITANGGNANTVKQMMIDAGASSSITWNMSN